MRTLLFATCLGLAALATVHCAADGTEATDVDAGDASPLPSPSGDAGAPSDAAADADGADSETCSADRWCPTSLPTGDEQLTAVWSFGPNDAIATTATSLLHWDGASWSIVNAAEAEGLTSLWATGPNDVWGVARFGHHLAHGTRSLAGEPFRWSRLQYDESSPSLELIRGLGASDLWAYGRTSEGGKAVQHGVIAAESDGDGGTVATVTWTTVPIDAPALNDVGAFWVTASREVWLAGIVVVGISGAGGVVRGVPDPSPSTGYTWTESLIGKPGDFVGHTAIWMENDDELWSIGNTGLNFRGSIAGDGGVRWTEIPSNAKAGLTGIWGVTKNDLWVVGRAGTVRHWDGSKWNVSRLAVRGLPMWRDLNAVHVGPAGDVWAVGSGVALHRAAGGSP